MHCEKVTNKQGTKWRCVADGPPDPVTGQRRQIARRGNTKKEAMQKVEDAIRALREYGTSIQQNKNIIFSDFAAEWLKTYSIDVKPSTVKVRLKELKILYRYIEKAKIRDISPKMYQDILDDLHKEGYARSSIEGVHVTAGMVFKKAVIWKVLEESPSTDAKIPRQQVTVQELLDDNTIQEKYLERGELQEYLEAAKKIGLHNDYAIFFTLAFTGLRIGELCALQWPDIDLKEEKVIKVRKTIYTETGRIGDAEFLTPKTPKSVRNVEINSTIIEVLQNVQTWQKSLHVQNRRNLVFCASDGRIYLPTTLERRVKRILRHTSISKRVTPHTLRHTHVSMLAEMKVDLKQVMERVGHADMRTTLKIYTHVTEKMRKDTQDKLTEYINDVTLDFS